MIYRYLFLVMAFSILLLGMDETAPSINKLSQNTNKITEEKKGFWAGRKQYLFVNLNLNFNERENQYTIDLYPDIKNEEEENGLAIEYYFQAYKRLYLKAGIGRTEYLHTYKVERKIIKSNYTQVGVAVAVYEGSTLDSITIDIDHMIPFNVSGIKTINGVTTSIEEPSKKTRISCNLNICSKHICGGIGIASTRYYNDGVLVFRIGAKW